VINADSFLVEIVRNLEGDAEIELAILALGWTKDQGALPCLLDLLNEHPLKYGYHEKACQAVARIGSPIAIPVLQRCLESEEFHALPYAFRALITLGDRNAVPLAIARVSPELRGRSSGRVVDELKRVTGESFGYDKSDWSSWWSSVENDWEIPEEFARPRED
jgi:hypothetical protein